MRYKCISGISGIQVPDYGLLIVYLPDNTLSWSVVEYPVPVAFLAVAVLFDSGHVKFCRKKLPGYSIKFNLHVAEYGSGPGFC